jgi:predicted secreted Zn-dependent protease
MEKLERRIFLLYAEIAGLNTKIVFLKTSDDPDIVKLRKKLRKKVGRLENELREKKKALA